MFLPEYVIKTLDVLKQNGFEGYVVGGCVRDALLGKTPDDYDITVSSFPEETERCFADCRIIETGLKHGTVTVIADGHPMELTTFRCDGEYKDNRHPESVTFTRNLENDLARRDFTVNAMAYSPDKGLVDLFGGREDLQKGVIRCVGDPRKRFEEDALRIMRGIRFASVLGFAVDGDTARAALGLAERLRNISAERIFVELKKLLCGRDARRVLTEYRGIIDTVFPLFAAVPDGAYAFAAEKAAVLPELPLKLTAFLAPLGIDGAAQTLDALKSDNKQRNVTDFILRRADTHFTGIGEVKRLAGEYGYDRVKELLVYRQTVGGTDDAVLASGVKALENANVCVRTADLAVNGNDIAALGFQGRQIGMVLQTLLEAVTDEKTVNEREALLRYLKNAGITEKKE